MPNQVQTSYVKVEQNNQVGHVEQDRRDRGCRSVADPMRVTNDDSGLPQRQSMEITTWNVWQQAS